jgi:hypothetical protein
MNSDYLHYRNSMLGQTLTDALDEMIHSAQIQPPLANRVLLHVCILLLFLLSRSKAMANWQNVIHIGHCGISTLWGFGQADNVSHILEVYYSIEGK